MVDVVEAIGHGDDHRGDGEGVEEGGQERAGKTEEQGDVDLRLHPDEDAGEGEPQEILHEVDAGDHEDQQQDNLEVGQRLLVDGVGLAPVQRIGPVLENGVQGVSGLFEGVAGLPMCQGVYYCNVVLEPERICKTQ